jgi:hypothetical protein
MPLHRFLRVFGFVMATLITLCWGFWFIWPGNGAIGGSGDVRNVIAVNVPHRDQPILV